MSLDMANLKAGNIIFTWLNKRKNPAPQEGEYRDELGFIRCSKCNGRRTTTVEHAGISAEFRCWCDCQRLEDEARKKVMENEEKRRRLEKLRSLSLLSENSQQITFDNTELVSESFKIAFSRCKKYCEIAETVRNLGMGAYLFGDIGVGKSHLATCMANELLNREYSVLFTGFPEISGLIRNSYDKNKIDGQELTENTIIKRLAEVDFLFIDDFGVEKISSWLQEKIFQIVNTRYSHGMPMIFTSNYSLSDLANKKGLEPRIVERIMEKTQAIQIFGKSYRWRKKQFEKPLF